MAGSSPVSRSNKPSGGAPLRIEDGNYRHLIVLAWTSPESYVGTVSNSGDNTKVAIAGVAQLVERNLAKVEVASSSLVSRSIFKKGSSRFPFLSITAR